MENSIDVKKIEISLFSKNTFTFASSNGPQHNSSDSSLLDPNKFSCELKEEFTMEMKKMKIKIKFFIFFNL